MINFDYVWKLALRDTDISEHLILLYSLAVVTDSKVIVEIGAGQSTFALTAAANKTGGNLYSFDLTKESTVRLFPKGEGVLDQEPSFHITLGDNLVTGKDWDKEIDFLFIDSSHLFDQTVRELELWYPRVKKGGFVLMHDTGKLNDVFADCRKALIEFKRLNPMEWVDMANQNGLSILRKV